MPLTYALSNKFNVLSGAGCVAQIGQVLTEAGYKKPFVIYDAGIRDTGVADRVLGFIRDAGFEPLCFDRVRSDPPDDIVEEAAELCKSSDCDCVIAIGGGSTMDTAKGVTVLRFNPGHILDYADPSVQMVYSPGLITIPTTSGTGSELSNGIIISNHVTNEKVPIVGYMAMSEYALLDPELTVGMPPALTGYTGLDVFSHAMEAYTTVLSSPITEPLCEKVMQEVVEYLPRAVQNGKDLEARQHMLMAASLGGYMLANCCAHVGHSLGHVIGAAFHMPHGAACAYACPAAMRFIAPVVPQKIRKVGEILGARFTGAETPEQIADITCAAYKSFRDNVVMVRPLAEYGIDPAAGIALAPKIPVECFAPLTPRPVTEADAVTMLTEVFA